MANKELLKGNTRLIILSALARQPMHGYALSKHLKTELAEMFKFGVGMLYPALHKMERERLIVGAWQAVEGADRRVYSVTKRGKRVLANEKARWRAFSSLVTNFVQTAV